MHTRIDCPFPVAWTADELASAVPRRLSAAFEAGIPTDMSSGARMPVFARTRRHTVDRGLPNLFRVR
ncbi:hypothetical protein LU699_11315 [Luteimonas fraxinea]|uniref:Uncharacterized protein n=1 Tax=Luteimonas fraxinea TaxID=2901869 RepID=A0ABS8UGI3_9GAMM|nr:hypothetical protein [Luteimonas fraxinea]MCD9098159.1 hypothetical protein [Luteimonas fraxinea]UHH08899.1 hypothetical protein LU699_11315 [Luteimonas fraxinea]